MAIELETEIGNSGSTFKYWALADVKIRPKGKHVQITGCYRLWLTRATYLAGNTPMRRTRDVAVVMDNPNPTLSDIARAFEKVLMLKSVEKVVGVAEVKAKPAVIARASVRAITAVPAQPATEGSLAVEAIEAVPAQPAVSGRPAVKAVKAVERVAAVKGGELEFGKIVK